MPNIAFTAPHAKASEIGLSVLKQGGSAVDAMVASAAAISVLYPHMNSLAGDGFWLIQKPGEAPVCIDGCGFAAQNASIEYYKNLGHQQIPSRGALAALTVGGTLDSWQKAREYAGQFSHSIELKDLLAPAVELAKNGIQVTKSLQHASQKVSEDLSAEAEYKAVFEPKGRTLQQGELLQNPQLAHFLTELGEQGLDSFYRGDIAKQLAKSLTNAGSPIQLSDLQSYQAKVLQPLSVTTSKGTFYNLPAPTQGIASLLILAIYDEIYQEDWSQAQKVHGLVEATKQAFLVRDKEVCDPRRLSNNWQNLLSASNIISLAKNISQQAMPWPRESAEGDTIWMGCVDKDGTMVSFIQSIYWEFGSGVVLPEYGLVWNNRGTSFSLQAEHVNALKPGYKPFHTLNPAFAVLNDGRRMSYGTMGGEGQPQTQAAIISRYLYDNLSLTESVNKGRWLLGRTWGSDEHDLKMEQDLFADLGKDLIDKGHQLRSVDKVNELMGHAGAIVLSSTGQVEATSDHRSDGAGLVDKISAKYT
ncbi:gamma-glutamyltransferase family protein [Paraglaciecola aquimarina]|uniref:Gamma-glutamyltransferase family protein n=1 Tax=Paraglaciecola algarum TaxID=3050085 RepID=A0ABS9D6V4_9ALTE|nr:gamma-glutamyltransferase family protein [Paraglaciecola sp. G1-23]MCF2948702.1 gamma-glutamyltransferase family protein [Paraglaciecola sp. G1-23]